MSNVIVKSVAIFLILSTPAFAQYPSIEQQQMQQVAQQVPTQTPEQVYQRSGMPRPAPPGVIPPVGPAYFPGFIVGPAPWQPMIPMW